MELAELQIGRSYWLQYDPRTKVRCEVIVGLNEVRPGMAKVRIYFGRGGSRSTFKWIDPAALSPMDSVPPAEVAAEGSDGTMIAYVPRAADWPPSSISYAQAHDMYYGRPR